MSRFNFISIIIVIVYFFSFSLHSKSADWSNFYWEKATITPTNLETSYWLEFYFLPDNPKYGFACGQEWYHEGLGVFAKTTDSGRTWQASVVDPSNQSFHAESVIFIDSLIGYVSGTSNVYKTIDGGRNWSKLNLNKGSWGCYAIGNKFWTGDGDCFSRQSVYISNDAGNTFSEPGISIPNSPMYHLTDFKMYDANGLGYCIGSGQIFRTLNGGNSWVPLNSTPVITWIIAGATHINWHEDLNIYDRSIVIPMSPGCYGNESDEGAVGFSTDLGATWNIFITEGSMFGTFILDETSGWACGNNNSVYWTKDAGRSWNKLACGLNDNINLDDLWFINDSTGFVCGDDGIYSLTQRQASPVDIAGDTVKCGDSVATLTATYFPNAIYSWYEIRQNGDTVLLTENTNTITVKSNGTYYVKVIRNNNECDLSISKPVSIQIDNTDKPIIEFNKTNYTFCRGSGELLSLQNNSSSWATITWYLDNKEIDSDKMSLVPPESGKYHVEVRTSPGDCLLASNSIELTITGGKDVLDITENELPLFIDSVQYGKQGWRSFRITNYGDASITLQDIGFKHKRAFTVPMWQFPLTIPAGGWHDVLIYYTPTDINLQADTLYIEDYCSTHTWYVSGFGQKNFDTTAGICDVSVAITTHSIRKSIQVFLPYPNPVNFTEPAGKISFNIITETIGDYMQANATLEQEQLPVLKFYNALGQPVSVAWEYKQGSTVAQGKQVITTGELQYTLKQLPVGVYFMQINYYDYNKVFSLVIN